MMRSGARNKEQRTKNKEQRKGTQRVNNGPRTTDDRRSLVVGRWSLVVIVLLFTLTACGGSGITQTGQTEHYNIKLSLDGVEFGERTATIDVSNLSGQPVTAEQVVLAPLMESMGMATPELTAKPIGPGRYQAKGEFFSMLGEWEVDVRVSVGGKEETARFKVQVIEP